MSGNGELAPLTDAERALWIFTQLYGNRKENADWFINFRAIHNRQPHTNPSTGQIEDKHVDVLFQQNVPVKGLFQQWHAPGGLYAQFLSINQDPQRPGNIYFGVNPRTHPTQNTKPHCAGYLGFYLDLDVNSTFSLEMRYKQINFWIACRLDPTYIINSGNGLHPYWIFKNLVPADVGQPLLKRMVEISGCKEGGNCHDVARVLRLPGFLNVKKWFKGETPPCALVYPFEPVIQDSYRHSKILKRYDLDAFEFFPPSSIAQIEALEAQAVAMGGNMDDNLHSLARAYKEQCRNQTVSGMAATVARQSLLSTVPLDQAAKKNNWTPTLTTIPPDLEEVPFPRKHRSWMMMYCRKGFDGLTPQEQDKIKAKVENSAASASELDYMIIYHLTKRGYTFEAIAEFWHRPGLCLLRPDKESRSPNYLEISYANAVKAVQETMTTPLTPEEQILKAAIVGNIQIKAYKVFLMKGDTAERIMHGEPIIRKVYEDHEATIPADREYFEIEFRAEDFTSEKGYKSYVQIVPRKAFHSPAAFKEFLHGDIVLLSDKSAHLSHLLNYLIITYANAPRVEFHSKVTYKDGKFIFPYLTIHADRFETSQRFDFVPELVQRFPWHESFVDTVIEKPDLKTLLKRVMPNILKVHMPQLVMSMIGTLTASATRTVLIDKKLTPAINIPTINIRGGSTRGKSLTAKLLFKIIGLKNDDPVISAESSKFALNRALGISNFVPFVVDEFKLEKQTEDAVSLIRRLMRRAYTGETVLRGQANLGLVQWKLTGAIIVIGETQLERVGDISEISRVMPVVTDDWDMARSAEAFLALQNEKLCDIGPHLLQFILNCDHKQLMERLNALYLMHIDKISDVFGREKARIAQNLAVLEWGCEIFDAFLRSVDPTLPTLLGTYNYQKDMVEYLKSCAEESGQSLVYTSPENKEVKVVTSRDELFEFIHDISQMITEQDEAFQKENEKNIFYYLRSEETNELLLQLNICYNAYTMHCKRLGKFPTDKTKIKSLIKSAKNTGQPWMVTPYKLVKRLPDTPRRYLVLNLKLLREMGVWHAEELEEPNKFLQSHEPGNPNFKNPPKQDVQSRISDFFTN